MKRLAVIPSDPITDYLKGGYSADWLRGYYNPCGFFDEVYLLSPDETDAPDLLGMRVIKTAAKDLKKRIKDLQIDVVRAYGGNWACRMACENKVKGVPIVVSVHDTNPEILYESIQKADFVFCVSKAVERLVKSRCKDARKIWLLPNRVDFKFMRPYAKSEVRDLDRKFAAFQYKIVHVGRLALQKNLDTVLKALKLLGAEYCVVAIGPGDVEPYQSLANDLGVAERVFTIGSCPHEKLARYFSWADCMCTPSRWEGFGMVFIEALASGGVVVTSDIAPMNEFIIDGENGVLVREYEDPKALAEAITRACTDVVFRNRLKAQARQSVEVFERSRIDKLESEYYRKVLTMKAEGDSGEHNKRLC